jgi:hypothetical protein
MGDVGARDRRWPRSRWVHRGWRRDLASPPARGGARGWPPHTPGWRARRSSRIA